MNIQICRRFCHSDMVPKFVIEFKNHRWFLQSDFGCGRTSVTEYQCSIIEIEPMNEFFRKNKKQILKNWKIELESMASIENCWRYVGNDPSYVLHNVRILCNQECPCKYAVEQSLSDFKHVERVKQVRKSEKISLSRVNIQ